LDEWNYDGSSTEQAEGKDSEVFIFPKKIVKCPLRGGKNILVMCDAWKPDGSPANTNFRAGAAKVFDACANEEPWFSFEQEYVLTTTNPDRPIGFPTAGYAEPQGPYYCANGSKFAFGREIMDAHYRACLHAGLNITGTNAEVFPGQWEY
jgi:glutamine synthetase